MRQTKLLIWHVLIRKDLLKSESLGKRGKRKLYGLYADSASCLQTTR